MVALLGACLYVEDGMTSKGSLGMTVEPVSPAAAEAAVVEVAVFVAVAT